MNQNDIDKVDELVDLCGDCIEKDAWNRIKEQKEKSSEEDIDIINDFVTLYAFEDYEGDAWDAIRRWITENKRKPNG